MLLLPIHRSYYFQQFNKKTVVFALFNDGTSSTLINWQIFGRLRFFVISKAMLTIPASSSSIFFDIFELVIKSSQFELPFNVSIARSVKLY